MKKLILGLIIFASCKTTPFEPIDLGGFEGVCKIKLLNEDSTYIGIQYLIYDSGNYEQHLRFVDSCDLRGGYYVSDNDSNGTMCYTCQYGQIWFPE